MRIGRHGVNAGWAAAILILLVGGASLWRLADALRVSRTTARIERVIATLDDVLSRLKDAETGQRGYVLTGDTAYLAPYHLASDGLAGDLNSLRHPGDASADQRARIAALGPLIGRRLREIDTTIILRDTRGFAPAVAVIQTNAGKRSMDSVRVAIATISAIETRRLVAERSQLTYSIRLAVIVIVGGTLGAFALALVAQGLVTRAASRLTRAAGELSAVNLEFEAKTRAADAASRAKTDFLAVMSHELRTPLNAIVGYTGLLLDGVGDPLSPGQSAALHRVRSASTVLIGLIDEILTYARLGRGNEVALPREVDLRDIVAEVLTLVEHVFDAKGLRLECQPGEGPLIVATDPLKVTHILLNLLTNAAKFTPSGAVRVVLGADNDRATIAVIDPGIGIRPEDRARVFDAFEQVDSRRARAVEGAGLGLTIARRLARLLGGDLTAESELGIGSTFTLWLPYEGATSPAGRSTTLTSAA